MRGKIRRGSVVNVYNHGKGVVLRLMPMNAFARAYGRQALVAFYGKGGRVHKAQVNVGDMTLLGRVRRVPKFGLVDMPHHPEEIAHHERIRDIRRAGQGAYYDPTAPHNLPYERPLPPYRELRVMRQRKKPRRRR